MAFDRVAYNKKYREEHKDYYKNYNKQWLADNKEHRQRYNKEWNINNRDKLHGYDKKRAGNEKRRLHRNLCTRIRAVLLGEYKSARTVDLLGCSIDQFKVYLESKFDKNMSWENYGSYWQIDHIKPCKLFDLSKSEEQNICFHYSNMQPLQASENARKQDKYPYEVNR